MIIRLMCLIAVSTILALDVTFVEKPVNYRLYPRDDANQATVRIQGTLRGAGYDSLIVAVTRNNRPFNRTAVPTAYTGDSVAFDFQLPIRAELAEYGFRLYADDSLGLAADSVVAGDAYAISGQSNAITQHVGDVHEYIRTYTGSGWKISEMGREYENGPEVGVWGQQLAFHINQEQGIPVFVVNGGVPATRIGYSMPGAWGYTDILNRTTLAGLRNHVKAIFWYQGEADCNPEGTSTYVSDFNTLYLGWRADYPAVKRVYVWQLPGTGGWGNKMAEIHRHLPETCPDVRVLATSGSPGGAGHWATIGCRYQGDILYRLVARDIYRSRDTAAITSPNLLRAWYSSEAKDRITLLFDQPVIFKDSLGHKMADYFALDSVYGSADSGWHELEFNRVVLKLKTPSNASRISYLTGSYLGTDTYYMGPFLFNPRHVGAMVFNDVPIEPPAFTDTAGLTGLNLTVSDSTLMRFESARLTAAITYSGALQETNRHVAFLSLDPFVAGVDGSGLVRAYNPGTARLIALRDGLTDTVRVSVNGAFPPLIKLAFTAETPSLRTLMAGDSMPLGLVALKVENGDTLRFSMDTLAVVSAPLPQLEARSDFLYALQAGDSLLVTAIAAGLSCSTRVTVAPLPAFIRRVNFQAVNAEFTSIPGWLLDSGTPYSPARGAGWVNAQTLTGGDLGGLGETNYFRKTTLSGPQNRTEQLFRLDAPPGRYRIRIRNFNTFFCQDIIWVRQGPDTLLSNSLCNYQYDWDKEITRDIEITGDSGLVLNIYGAICYIVLAADDGTDFNLIAKDDPGVIYPPPLITETDKHSSPLVLNETPMACPNPFNPSTIVRFGLPAKISAEYGVYNIRGQCVRRYLLHNESAPRERMITVGNLPASGVYYGRLVRSDGKRFIHRLALVK